MAYNPEIHRRRSLRLKGYDYTHVGAYFVTIVTQGRSCLFGEIVGKEMRLNEAGEMVCGVWESLPQRFPAVEMDMCVVMPNHLHGIIVIKQPKRATTRVAPTNRMGDSTRNQCALGDVIGAYKSLTTVEYVRGVKTTKWAPFRGRLWHRNYYEHVVRHEESLRDLQQYILDNPAQWAFDKENPLAKTPAIQKL